MPAAKPLSLARKADNQHNRRNQAIWGLCRELGTLNPRESRESRDAAIHAHVLGMRMSTNAGPSTADSYASRSDARIKDPFRFDELENEIQCFDAVHIPDIAGLEGDDEDFEMRRVGGMKVCVGWYSGVVR